MLLTVLKDQSRETEPRKFMLMSLSPYSSFFPSPSLLPYLSPLPKTPPPQQSKDLPPSGMANMLTLLYDFLVEESRKGNVGLILLPTTVGGSNEANDKASVATGKIATRCLPSQDTAKTPGATGAPLRLIGWQVENVNAWWRSVDTWYQEISGKDNYKKSAFSMMLRRNGFRPWNTSAAETLNSGWDYRLRRKDVSCHGYILDAAVLQKYGVRCRRGEKARQEARAKFKAQARLSDEELPDLALSSPSSRRLEEEEEL